MSNWKPSQIANLIRYVPTGIYYARFRVTAGGKSKVVWRSLKTDDVEIAKQALADVVKNIRENGPRAAIGAMITVGDALDALAEHEFAFGTRRKPAKPRTLDYYRQRLAALLVSWPGLRAVPLRAVTADQCERWAKAFSRASSAPAFNNTLMVLRNAFKLAVREAAVKADPTANIRRMTPKSELPELPTREQFTDMLRVLDCAVHPYARAISNLVRLMAFSGMRLREASGLQWGDADFERGMLWVVRQRDETGRIVTPKNGQRRYVEMNPALRELLLMMRGPDVPDKTLRVTRVDSCQISLDNAAKVVGCPRITHHDLRHLFITACVESGVDFRTIAEWVGHQDGGILIGRLYSHLRRDHSQRMAAKVEFKVPLPVAG